MLARNPREAFYGGYCELLDIPASKSRPQNHPSNQEWPATNNCPLRGEDEAPCPLRKPRFLVCINRIHSGKQARAFAGVNCPERLFLCRTHLSQWALVAKRLMMCCGADLDLQSRLSKLPCMGILNLIRVRRQTPPCRRLHGADTDTAAKNFGFGFVSLTMHSCTLGTFEAG